ncbi:MAG TPA: zinc ribbon domain-containing protein [Clostridia bacterium]
MALRKEGPIYCDKCGSELDHTIVCSACGIMYPDYYLVRASKPPRRQAEKPDLFSFTFGSKPSKQTYTYSYSPSSKPAAKAPILLMKRVGVLVLLAFLVIGALYIYNLKKSEKMYAQDYMRALYVLKSGTDLGLNTCEKISSDWKVSGQGNAPHISTEDETRLNQIKDAAEKYLQKLNEPPKKFVNAKGKLSDLYGAYIKVHTLAVTPSGSLTNYTNSVSKSGNDFNVAIRDLKSSLPKELSAEFKVAQGKYKGLKDI